MCTAKQAGRNPLSFLPALLNTEVQARVQLGTARRVAVVEEQFVLPHQPEVHVAVAGASHRRAPGSEPSDDPLPLAGPGRGTSLTAR